MASGPRTTERLCDSETDEQNFAQRKKRLRSVSFAEVEITSVYVFERDESNETPPADGASTKNQTPEPENEVLGFFKELADGNDDLGKSTFCGGEAEEEEVEDPSARKSFLQPMESPGSSIFDSATRLVGAESGDLKTPTKVRFGFGEKNPSSLGTPSNPGSLMKFTMAKRCSVDLSLIDMLQDILDHQQNVKIRQMFLSQIQQKICDRASKKMPDRTAEMRNLICKLVFERARVQKRKQMLSIAVQESQMLKSSEVLCLPVPSLHIKDKVPSEKLVALRHEFEALEGKLNTSTQHFRSEYKIGTEASCSLMIGMVNDQLKKRISCRHIYKGIQVCSSGVDLGCYPEKSVQDLANKNGAVSIVLNYLDLLSQRLTITGARTPSLLVSTELNEANIMKKFTNMDACAAFAYVLNAEATMKYVGSRSLAQETRMACSLLHNLLDVVQELQKARIESINFVDATFASVSGNSPLFYSFFLALYCHVSICFGNCGVYPSDIIPHSIQVSRTKKSNSEALSAQAKAAVDNLRAGCFRILGLCRCISQAMKASGKKECTWGEFWVKIGTGLWSASHLSNHDVEPPPFQPFDAKFKWYVETEEALPFWVSRALETEEAPERQKPLNFGSV
ncbi:unnamed protein product [Linum tenue]|uniref:Uncharacterized protein n=1 Tax=Linum tenue TaxID=586396 RepID=A0AAV0NLZ1_9ROSI|nr:unnamed protein product [Linum tenue]